MGPGPGNAPVYRRITSDRAAILLDRYSLSGSQILWLGEGRREIAAGELARASFGGDALKLQCFQG